MLLSYNAAGSLISCKKRVSFMSVTNIQMAMSEPVHITAESFATAVKKYQWFPNEAFYKGQLSKALQGCSLPYDGVVKDVLIKMYNGKTVLRVAASAGHFDVIKLVLALVPKEDRFQLQNIREKLGRYSSLWCHKRWNTPLHDAVTAKNNALETVDAILSPLTPKEQLELLCASNDLARTPHDIAEQRAVKQKLKDYKGNLSRQIAELEKTAADWKNQAATNKAGADMWKKIAEDKEGQLEKKYKDKVEKLERECSYWKTEAEKHETDAEKLRQEKADIEHKYERHIKELEELHIKNVEEIKEEYGLKQAEDRARISTLEKQMQAVLSQQKINKVEVINQDDKQYKTINKKLIGGRFLEKFT